MTRINLIPPEDLHNKHLMAEYRELPRLFALIRDNDRKRVAGIKLIPPPDRYVLGRGHVRFFYDKAIWLLARQKSLIVEMRRRGMKPQFEADEALLAGIDMEHQLDTWSPDADEITLNVARINERLSQMGII